MSLNASAAIIGLQLATARRGRGWTQRQLARHSGLARETIYRIENGLRGVHAETLRRMDDVLGTHLGGSAERPERVAMRLDHPGKRFRALRRQNGMTLAVMACAVGVSAATLSRFERGIGPAQPGLAMDAQGTPSNPRLATLLNPGTRKPDEPARATARTSASSDRNPMVRALILLRIDRLASDLGGDLSTMMGEAGIHTAILDRPYAFIAYRRLLALLDLMSRRLECPDFGIRLAIAQDDVPPGHTTVDMLRSHAPTLRHAFELVGMYFATYAPDGRYVFQTLADGAEAVILSIPTLGSIDARQIARHALMRTHMSANAALGLTAAAREVWIARSDGLCARAMAGVFGTDVRLDAPHDALVFAPGMLDRPIMGRDEARFQMAMDFAGDMFSPDRGPFSRHVEWLLTMKDHQFGNCADIAAQFHIHPRALQRRLRGEGETFAAIRDRCRRAMALRYLRNRDIRIARAAAMLGYAQRTALPRRCQAWFGMSAAHVRQRGL